MAFRNVLHCFECVKRFLPRIIIRIHGEDNAHKEEIAIRRCETNNMPPLELKLNTKISAINVDEINIIEQDPTCFRINVLTE